MKLKLNKNKTITLSPTQTYSVISQFKKKDPIELFDEFVTFRMKDPGNPKQDHEKYPHCYFWFDKDKRLICWYDEYHNAMRFADKIIWHLFASKFGWEYHNTKAFFEARFFEVLGYAVGMSRKTKLKRNLQKDFLVEEYFFNK